MMSTPPAGLLGAPAGITADVTAPETTPSCDTVLPITSIPRMTEQREGEWITRGTRARSPRPKALAARLKFAADRPISDNVRRGYRLACPIPIPSSN
jgi:hypothetical protein